MFINPIRKYQYKHNGRRSTDKNSIANNSNDNQVTKLVTVNQFDQNLVKFGKRSSGGCRSRSNSVLQWLVAYQKHKSKSTSEVEDNGNNKKLDKIQKETNEDDLVKETDVNGYTDKLGYLKMLWKREKSKAKQSCYNQDLYKQRKTEYQRRSTKISGGKRLSLNIVDNDKLSCVQKGDKWCQFEDETALLCQLMLLHKLTPSNNDIEGTHSNITDFDLRLDEKHFQYYPFIFKHLRDREMMIKCNSNYLINSGFNESFRTLLIDWLVKVQVYCKCRSESLYVAVSLTDSILSIGQVRRSNYQLVGLAAFLVGCKVVQRGFPKLQTLCYLTENCYTVRQLRTMELCILTKLTFFVHVPLATHFLHRGLLACVELADIEQIENLCKYIIEMSLLDSRTHLHRPSSRSAASILLSRHILHQHQMQPWTRLLQYYTRYSVTELTPVLSIMLDAVSNVYDEQYPYKAILDKYSKPPWLSIGINEKVVQFGKSKLLQEDILKYKPNF